MGRDSSLFDLELVEPITLQVRREHLGGVREVAEGRLSEAALLALFRCLLFLVLSLQDYGDEMYKEGYPWARTASCWPTLRRSTRWARPHMHVAWAMVTR